MKELAIVTTGGTQEAIDDVRYITNFSTGRFAHEIAKALADLGYEVIELVGRHNAGLLDDYPGVTKQTFTSAESLQDLLLEYKDKKPAIVIQAAAVADYTPIPVKGKISSDKEELVIHLKKTPKILSKLRDAFGDETYLVGFKLLSSVSREELERVAKKQFADNRLDMTIANDLSQLNDGQHPVMIVRPDTLTFDVSGSRSDVARALAGCIVRGAKRKR